MGYGNISKKKETVKVADEQKFGSASDYIQYNPNTQNTTNFMRQGLGASPTASMNEFMSSVAPQIPAFFTSQQSPLMASLTDRAKTLSGEARANVANQFSGLNAVYSTANANNMASAMAQPFADVQNQLGGQLVDQSGNALNSAMGNYFQDQSTRLNALTSLSAPQYYNPYTYQGAQYAAAPQGNWFTNALGGVVQGAGMAGGAALFSDKRLKTNVKSEGKYPNGLNKYSFEYKNKPGFRYTGVLAQEILEEFPAAVVIAPNGYLAVNYSMLGINMERQV